MIDVNYLPKKPFDSYKWFFATKAPTESLGDPAVLLGLITRIAPLAEKGNIFYSSKEFELIMQAMNTDTITPINLADRVGERNLMRNSAQYWKLFGLIPQNSRGIISITDFAKNIVDGKISQIDFASAMILSIQLPNRVSYTEKEFYLWRDHELTIHPFKLILQILRILFKKDPIEGYLTNEELYSVIIPMVGDKQKNEIIAEYILSFRDNPDLTQNWYNAVPRSNDKRFTAEFLRFLANFGFVEKVDNTTRDTQKFYYISELDNQISELIDGIWGEEKNEILRSVRMLDIESSIIQVAISRANRRPRQQQFRKKLIENVSSCAITGNSLLKVLQAAHIKPYAYGGDDDISNGLLMRADIHILFDAGLLYLRPDSHYRHRCFLELSQDVKSQINYPNLSNEPNLKLPDFVNMDNIEWRYENRLLGIIK